MRWFLAALLASPALAQAGPPPLGRATLSGYGGWAYSPAAPTPGPIAQERMAGCAGLGVNFLPEKATRGRRGRWHVQPSHQRIVVRFIDIRSNLGAGDGVMMAPLQVGYGGQWGGRHLYLATQLEGGFGGYLEPEGSRAIRQFGVTLKPKVALGLQLGPVGVEVGPTLRTLVPLLTSVHNSDDWSGSASSASLDVEVHFGGGAGPKRWY